MNENEYVRKDVYEADRRAAYQQLEDLEARFSDYKEQSSKQVNFWGITVSAIAVLFAVMQIGIALMLWFFTK